MATTLLVVLHLSPNCPESSNIDLDLITELIDKAEKIEHLSYDSAVRTMVFDGLSHHLIYVLLCQNLVQVLLTVLSYSNSFKDTLQNSTHLLDVVMSGKLVYKTVDDISAVRFHFVSLGYYFTVLLCRILIECLMLALSQNNAFKK